MACDVSNLWKACRGQFGPTARVNFQLVAEMVPGLRYPQPVRQHLVAYLVTNPKRKHLPFLRALQGYGFDVRERHLVFDKAFGSDAPGRTDWDVGITIDAMAKMEEYDTFVLVSGDGDFAPLLRHLHNQGKNTLVFTFSRAASRLLYGAADQVVLLTDTILLGAQDDHHPL